MKAPLFSALTAGLFWIALSGNAVAYGQTLTADAAPSTNPPVGPTPRLSDGKVDLGGKGVWAPIWVLDWADKKYVEQNIDVPFTPAGMELYKERQATHSKDDPEGYCLPAGVPRYTGTPYPFQIIQLPDRVVILYEGASHMYRVILLNAKHWQIRTRPGWENPSAGTRATTRWWSTRLVSTDARGWITSGIPPAISCMSSSESQDRIV